MQADYGLIFGGETLVLRADRSVWWPAQRVLFIADVHAGKVRHMALAGLRLPAGSLAADLARLSAAAGELQPERIIVLGDLFHSDSNSEWDELVAWRRTLDCTFELVRGNHDRFMSDEVLQADGMLVHPEGYQLGPFVLRHHPLTGVQATATSAVLCGHVHPVFTAYGLGADKLRLTCFVVQADQIILPAFGSFTGGYDVKDYSYRQLVGCGPDYQQVLIKQGSREPGI